MNTWGLDICFIGSADDEWERAQAIVTELAEHDGRVGDAIAACWPFEFGMTQLELDGAIAEVERLLTAIDKQALVLLSVRQAS